MPKDNFSSQAQIYSLHRPGYPGELFDFIFQHVAKKNAALDCATGNGQAAVVMAEYFDKVYAIDISKKQIALAIHKPNIHYSVSKAENTPFADNSFDCITVAAALHWFDVDDFYKEVNRIIIPAGVIACWAYGLLSTGIKNLDTLLKDFYLQKINAYWDPERKHIDEAYKNIPFPFKEIANPGFESVLEWDSSQLEGYLNSWSSVQHFIRKNNYNPVVDLMKEVNQVICEREKFEARFPIFMRIGRIK
jgi:ubiquinone/menaquinone biosynthesis C-methylase UbiE